MSRRLVSGVGLVVTLLASAAIEPAPGVPVGPFFTYQGQLQDNGAVANGNYDLRFRLYDASVNGIQVGRIVEMDDVPVFNGLFTAELDFGSDVFTGEQRFLEVAVRPGNAVSSDPYTVLSPRQNLTAAPYALYAREAGHIPWSRIEDVPLQFLDGTDNDTTYVAGTGLTLTGVQFSVNFAGTGGAFTAARSDHHHSTVYVAKTGDSMTGDLMTPRVRAGVPASPACDGTGDLCAADDVVADGNVLAVFDVLAGRDVRAATLVKAGTPSSPECAGAGQVCADHNVVADDAVRAGGDVTAGSLVKAGTVTNPSCSGAGDVCAGDDLVADRQVVAGTVNNPNCSGTGDICAGADLSADGNVYQGRAANGLVKAGVTAHCTYAAAHPFIVRSFNNVNAAAITISGGADFGECTIDFGFQVEDRYLVATAQGNLSAVTVSALSGNTASFARWRPDGQGESGSIHVLVY